MTDRHRSAVTAERAKTSPDTTVSESRDDLAAELRRLRGVNHTLTVALDGANAKIAELEANLDHLRTEGIPVIQQRRDELIARVAELEELVEVEYAGRMRLAERVRAVRKLHHEVDVPALGPDCSAEECDHENDCPPVPTPVCDHCHAIGESASPYPFEEAPGLTEVLWPCKTIRILDSAETDDEAGAFLDAITTDEADQ